MFIPRSTILVAVCALVWSGCSADAPSTPPLPTASPPPNPTTLTGITISYHELMLVEAESATLVITLRSDPGEDIEVHLRFTEGGADDATITPNRLVWTAADWQQPMEVEITAIPDEVTERVETHELEVWTYRRAERDPGQHILAPETIRLTLADSRGLVVLTGDAEGEFVLEWTPADRRTDRWQYRYRRGDERAWHLTGTGERAWQDIPNSHADTQDLRVTVPLEGYEWGYLFQVRPLPGSAGGVSQVVQGAPGSWYGPDGIPMPTLGFPLERGGRFRFSSSGFTYVVPHNMLLMVTQASGPGRDGVTIIDNLWDLTTEAQMSVDTRTGEVLRKTFWDARTNSYTLVRITTGEIERTWKGLPPPPSHDLAALWDEIEQSIRWEPPPPQ